MGKYYTEETPGQAKNMLDGLYTPSTEGTLQDSIRGAEGHTVDGEKGTLRLLGLVWCCNLGNDKWLRMNEG